MVLVRTLILAICFAQVATATGAQDIRTQSGGEASKEQPELRYGIDPTRLFYRLTVKADLGSPRFNRETQTDLVYGLKKTESGDYQIVSLEGKLKSPSRSYRSSHPIFRIGPMTTFVGSSLNVATIKPTGEVVKVTLPRWIMGLPVDVGRLPFPHFRNEDRWTTEEPISLVHSTHSSSYLQLLPVSPAIRHPFREQASRIRRNEETSQVVAIARTEWKLTERTPSQAVVRQTYLLQGEKFGPAITVVGDGKIVFSIERSSVDSIEQTYRVTWKEPNQSVTAT